MKKLSLCFLTLSLIITPIQAGLLKSVLATCGATFTGSLTLLGCFGAKKSVNVIKKGRKEFKDAPQGKSFGLAGIKQGMHEAVGTVKMTGGGIGLLACAYLTYQLGSWTLDLATTA